jgi:ligand-binding SRPBCC domain-containing protein
VTVISLETPIDATPERCFDLSLSVDVHLASTSSTGERVVDGPTSGLFARGDTVTWEARHFGRLRRLTVRIGGYDRPRWFRDEIVHGPFRRMQHDHWFEATDGVTLMRDRFDVAVFPVFDRLVLAPYLRRFLVRRNALIRQLAETE